MISREEENLYRSSIKRIEESFDKKQYILKLIYENFNIEYPEEIDASVLFKNAQNVSESMALTIEKSDINEQVKEESQKLFYYFQERNLKVESKINFDESYDLLDLIAVDEKNEKIKEYVKKNMEEISKKYTDLIRRIEIIQENENE